MGTRDQGHCLTFVQGHSDLYLETSSAAKPLSPFEAKFRAFMNDKNESLFKWFWLLDQDDQHAHIW